MDNDERGFRVALVADEFVNPSERGFDAVEVLRQEDWGVIQLPPDWYQPAIADPMLDQIAEHVEEFARHGYQLVLLGNREGLEDALRASGLTLPDIVEPGGAGELLEFLQARPPADPALARGETS